MNRISSFEKFERLLAGILIVALFFYSGYYFGKRGYLFEVRRNPPKIEVINRYPNDSKVDFKLFWDVWDTLTREYLNRPVDGQKLLYGAISGMVDAAGDPYTSFLAPEINKSMTESINGKYHGIGAELGLEEEQLVVVSPLDGSPAKFAGIKAKDKILRIDGTSTLGISISEAVAKIRGNAGTKVVLTIQSGDEDARDIEIIRGVISIDSVTWKDKGDGVAYIRISRFGGETNTEWDNAVSQINTQMKELDAVILDLRGNPGGYLLSSVYIAEEFFNNKPVLWQEMATGEQEVLKASRSGGKFANIPSVMVLIDGGSASASEILAAALSENLNAQLIGEKSFGKGTIQDVKDFEDGSGLHITIAKWLTPNKVWVGDEKNKGLTPTIEVKITEEDAKAGKDAQLDKALELSKKI